MKAFGTARLGSHLAELEKDVQVAKGQYQGACDIIKELERKLAEQQAALFTIRTIVSGCDSEEATHTIRHLQKHFNNQHAELDNILAKAKEEGRKEFRKNAMRYQWLRSQVNGEQLPMAQVVWKSRFIRDSGEWTNLIDGNNLDEHIDLMLTAFPKDPTYSDLIASAPKPQGETNVSK